MDSECQLVNDMAEWMDRYEREQLIERNEREKAALIDDINERAARRSAGIEPPDWPPPEPEPQPRQPANRKPENTPPIDTSVVTALRRGIRTCTASINALAGDAGTAVGKVEKQVRQTNKRVDDEVSALRNDVADLRAEVADLRLVVTALIDDIEGVRSWCRALADNKIIALPKPDKHDAA
jgi:hypothetical protein